MGCDSDEYEQQEKGELMLRLHYISGIMSEFSKIDFEGTDDEIRGSLERARTEQFFELIPFENRYNAIITGLLQYKTEETIKITESIKDYWESIRLLPRKKRPCWNRQYSEIINRILQIHKLYSSLSNLSKQLFKPGNARKWVEEVRIAAAENNYSLKDVICSIQSHRWMKTKLDKIVNPKTKDWEVLEGWCEYLDLKYNPQENIDQNPKSVKNPQKPTVKICEYCKKEGHLTVDCYHMKHKCMAMILSESIRLRK